jgi:hypothetical protein
MENSAMEEIREALFVYASLALERALSTFWVQREVPTPLGMPDRRTHQMRWRASFVPLARGHETVVVGRVLREEFPNMRVISKLCLIERRRWAKSVLLIAGAGMLVGTLSACGSVTSQQKVAVQREALTGQTTPSGGAQFLGSEDASLLKPGAEGEAAWVYTSSDVQWSNYKKVMLEPVEFWNNPDSSVSPDDQKMLCLYFLYSLQRNLGKNFTLVNQPGPGVMTVRVSIINAKAATPGLRSFSVVWPSARILNYVQWLLTRHAAFAGSAEAAFKATDSTTGLLLAESVDNRIGGMAVITAAQVQWGDAKAVMDYWAERITRLPELTQPRTTEQKTHS